MKNATLLHIPHASTKIPEQYLGQFDRAKLPQELNVMTDWFCDELFDCGRDRLVFPISRLVCDVERFRDDGREIMAKLGMGVLYRSASDLTPLRSVTEKDRQEILTRCYDAHHEAFTKAVGEKLGSYGHCLIVDCHSFYPSALPYELCRDEERPDICIGTSDCHTPKAMSEMLVRFFSERGYNVRVNSPFAGTIVPMEYFERDRKVSSVMIEVNRRLYLAAPGVKSGSFGAIRSLLRECIETLESLSDT